MAAADQLILVLYVLLGAVAGIIYALRRIILLERRLIGMEQIQIRIERSLLATLTKRAKKTSSPVAKKKTTKRRKRKR